MFEQVTEVLNKYQKSCEEYGITPTIGMETIIREKIEYVVSRNDYFLNDAKKSIDYMGKKYTEYQGKTFINTILEKREQVHFHMLIVWDEHNQKEYKLYPIKQTS